MARGSAIDTDLLNAALIGYEIQRDRIDALIAGIRTQLGQRGRGTVESDEAAAPASAGRARARHTVPVSAPKAKRRLSAAGRAKIVEATKARWEAYRAAKAQKAASKRER